jgi:hypothetical protein
MVIEHSNKTHQATCILAEGTRQNDVAQAVLAGGGSATVARSCPCCRDKILPSYHRFLLSQRLVVVELHPGAARSWNGRQLMSAPTKRPRGKRRYFSADQSRLSRHS